ncbi:pilus assembly PilX family protein [Wielerella bovis]|uniref:pilus assembly PilX family protein n=1 Tax=Wielerella bovis TaxID=2917790 RepID=UPI0024B7A0DB|nr:PilX N-terminal domain-containing pilus assembly protein [Wielerella bovis]
MKFKTKQQGFSLFMVMILMLVIALLVMVSVQSSTTEMRMSTNEADRKFAVSLAENGLREAEGKIRQLAQGPNVITFTAECTNGYCAAAEDGVNNSMEGAYFKLDKTANSAVPAWERCTNSTNRCDVGKTVLDNGCNTSNRCITTNNGKVHYVIEYLGNRSLSDELVTDYFRVTSRARGNNQDTIVTLQTHVELQTP